MDEDDDLARVDAWWNPPPSVPVSCPSIPPLQSQVVPAMPGRRRATISLEIEIESEKQRDRRLR